MLYRTLRVSVLAIAFGLAAVGSASATTYYAAPGVDGVNYGPCSSQAIGVACDINTAVGLAVNPGDDVALMAGFHSRYNVSTDLYVKPGVTIHGIAGQARPSVGTFGGLSCSCGVLRLQAGATARDIDVNYAWPYTSPYATSALLLEGGSHLDGVKAFATRQAVYAGFADSVNPITITRSTLATRGFNGSALEVTDTNGDNTVVNIEQSTLRATDPTYGTGLVLSHFNPTNNVSTVVNVHNTIVQGGYRDASINGSIANNVTATAIFRSSSIDFGNVNTSGQGTAVNLGGNVSPEPTFADNGGFEYLRPVPGSNTIDRGSAPFPATDLAGTAFFSGCGPDIGAYETVTAPCPPSARVLAGVKVSVKAKRKNGKVAAKITCPKAAVGSCTGTLSVKKGKAKAKTTKVKAIKPGKSKTLKVKAKKGKNTITATLTDRSGAVGTKTISKKLK